MNKFYAEGTYKARGRIIGEAYREEIQDLLEIMRTQEIPAMFNNADWKETIEKFDRDTGVYDNFRKCTGELFEEIEGMAEAANADLKELIILNCLDEISSYSLQNEIAEKCTCIGAKRKSDGRVFVAQNLDLSTHLNKHQMVLHTKYENCDLEQLVFTIPGLLGFTGVNNKSVAVVPNALTTLKYNPKGVPVTIILRRILEANNAKQAVNYVNSITHGAAQNYTIGDTNGIFSLECSGDIKEQFEPCENEDINYLVHTNHPLKNKEISVPGRVNMPVSSYDSTIQRLVTAEAYLKKGGHAFDEKDLEAVLTDHDHAPNCICRHGQGNRNMTIGSVIYNLTDKPEMYFAKGPGCINPYEKYSF